MENIIRNLEELGLTETQARIYVALVSLQKATVLQLARATGIQRPTIYENIAALEKQRLVHRELSGAKKYIVCDDPKALYTLLDQKRTLAQNLLGDLETLKKKQPQKELIKVYSGKEGAERLAEIILGAKDKHIRSIGSYSENISKMFTRKFNAEFWTARAKKGCHTKLLFLHDEKTAIQKDSQYSEVSNIKYDREVRLLPEGISFTVFYTIVDNKVLFWSSIEENFFYCMESESYAQSIRTLFDHLWKESQPLY